MRVSIKPHLQPYFRALQEQMECSNPTEALNHLLMDLKRQGYAFLEGYQYKPEIILQQPKQPLPQDDIPQNEDPFIQRLLEIGIEEF
ncbi:hypothetical protein [Nostoc sp. FACHB-110]|uniref:hypothetical protein n=1 Tax=Nostoc sp. FACHB-110 TaxID=2692834 RepID=UPI0016881143|nr:hypothetical protein [Nostoc sp. FACHB-110]MBD2438809.1 hypothetical protein [Nostoc sp. FACHB-110]